MSKLFFPDITLCSIVKNEMHNRGGGIDSFVKSIVPYVGNSVIVDTGSTDGTLERLKEMKSGYPNLEVYERDFDDFASSRNYSLSKASLGKVLILDADERISYENLVRLKEEIEESKEFGDFGGYLLNIENIFENGDREEHMAPLNPRLFELEKGVYFENTIGNHSEELRFKGRYFTCYRDIFSTSVIVDHYYTPKDYY